MKICPACQSTYGDDARSCPRDGAALIAGILEPGALLRKKYQIVSLIGFGGMAVVYRVRNLLWNEDRAVKILRQPCGDSFLAEAQIMRRLEHPNIVRVDDADFTEDDRPFVVMEFVEGEDLRRRMRRDGNFTPEVALRIAADTCAALAAAHGSGVVHRDIKPQNLLLARGADGTERVKVIDFGIAKVREDAGMGFTGVVPTMTGDFIGTPEYASPEQATGIRSSELDGRTDLYSLGLVLYEMLTGVLPFQAATPMGILVQRLQVAPAPPESHRSDLPPGVCELVMRAIQREREDRFASAAEMRSACEREIAAIERARADVKRREEEARLARIEAQEKREELERRRRQRRAQLRDIGKRVSAAIRHPRLAPRNVLIVTVATVLTGILAAGVFTYSYVKYAKLLDAALTAGSPGGSVIYGAPRRIAPGDALKPEALVEMLRLAGYSESRTNPLGYFQALPSKVEIFPGVESYFDQEADVVRFQGGRVAEIISLRDNTRRNTYSLEPLPIGSLGGNSRTRVRFRDLPTVLVNAVTAAEDPGFFAHFGINPLGGQTISVQLADLMLHAPGPWGRGVAALELEQKLGKEQIFETYLNSVAFGERGGRAIVGVDDAARTWFGKPASGLSLPEAAALAGLVHCSGCSAGALDVFRNRRNEVLTAMREAGYLTDRDYFTAIESPLQLVTAGIASKSRTIPIVKDALAEKFPELDFEKERYRILSSIDPDLQAFGDRIAGGIGATLVAVDPHTGEILAVSGSLAAHRFSSAFQPLVYAAGLNSAVGGTSKPLTPSTTVLDEPTTFYVGNKAYEPLSASGEFQGQVSLRQALARSLVVPAVKVSEMVSYDRVAELANSAGLFKIVATPDLTLGAFDVSPIQVVRAYTLLANHGVLTGPSVLSKVSGADGKVLYLNKAEEKTVLDPRVAYLVTGMMQEVLRTGLAATARTRGFLSPAAVMKEPGESGWFAGYTSAILCVVWAPGKGEGGSLPIWTEFMKHAGEMPRYRASEFQAPSGIVALTIDPQSGAPATARCPNTLQEFYIAGTEPTGSCKLHGRGPTAPPRKQTVVPATSGAAGGKKKDEKKGTFKEMMRVFK